MVQNKAMLDFRGVRGLRTRASALEGVEGGGGKGGRGGKRGGGLERNQNNQTIGVCCRLAISGL